MAERGQRRTQGVVFLPSFRLASHPCWLGSLSLSLSLAAVWAWILCVLDYYDLLLPVMQRLPCVPYKTHVFFFFWPRLGTCKKNPSFVIIAIFSLYYVFFFIEAHTAYSMHRGMFNLDGLLGVAAKGKENIL